MPRPRAMHEGSKITQEWIAVGDMRVDAAYQRPLREKWVRRTVNDFDPDLLNALYLSRRDDGDMVVLDGQQRREVVIRKWGDREKVPCTIAHGLSVEEEAAIYAEINRNRSKPRPIDLFRANLVAGDEVTVDMDRIIRRNGYKVGTGLSLRSFQAVVAAEQVYRRAGPDIFDATLSITSRAGLDEPIVGEIVTAVALILARYPLRVDRDRLIKTLGAVPTRRLIGSARAYKTDVALKSLTLGAVVAQMLVRRYNQNLRTVSRRIEWVEVTDRRYWLPVSNTTDDE